MEASSSDFEDLEPRLESEEDLLKSWSVLEKEVGKRCCFCVGWFGVVRHSLPCGFTLLTSLF